MNREHNAICRNRNESRKTCISGNDVFLSARCKWLHSRQSSMGSSVTTDSYEWTLHPREQCESMIVSRMKNFRCTRVTRSRKTWTAFINIVLIYSKPSPESQTLGTAVSGDKWLLLSGPVPYCRVSLLVSLSPNFISLNKVLLFVTALSLSIRSSDEINRWYRDVHVLSLCAHTRKMKVIFSRLIVAVGSNTNILSSWFKVQWFNAETQKLTRWIQNAFERHFIRTYSCCIQIVWVKVCLYNSTPGNINIQLRVAVNLWHTLSNSSDKGSLKTYLIKQIKVMIVFPDNTQNILV